MSMSMFCFLSTFEMGPKVQKVCFRVCLKTHARYVPRNLCALFVAVVVGGGVVVVAVAVGAVAGGIVVHVVVVGVVVVGMRCWSTLMVCEWCVFVCN